MKIYDALISPNPEEWRAIDAQHRLELVREYHRRIRAAVPRAARETHILAHVIIENLLVGEDGPVLRSALNRLVGEGLDRHEALHALGCVLLAEITDDFDTMSGFSVERYLAELDNLSADNWRRDYG